MHLIRTMIIILGLCLLSSPVLAETYYVSPTGSQSDQKIINDAIDKAAEDGGGTVYLTSGIYLVDGPVIIKSNVMLTGDSDAIIRVAPYPHSSKWFTGQTGIICNPEEVIHNVVIWGFQIDGNIKNLPASYANSRSDTRHDCEKLILIGGWSSNFGSNIKIHDMKLYNAFSDGIYIRFSKGVACYNNFISNCQHEGIFFSCVVNGSIYGNKIAGITSDCARLDNCQNCKIHDNIFFAYKGDSYGAYKGGHNGLQIGNAGVSHGYDARNKPFKTKNIEVFNNVFSDPGLRAIWYHGGENVYIHDNEFKDAAVLETMGVPIGDISFENQPTIEMTEKVFDSIFDIFSMDFTTQAGNNDTVILPEGVKEIPSEAIGTITQYEQGNLSYTLVSVPTVGLSEVRYEVNGKVAVHTLMLGEKQGSKIIFSNCSIWSGDFDRIGDSLYLEGVVEPEDIEVTCVSPVNEFKPILDVEQVETPNRFFHPILKFVFMVIFGAIGFIYLNLKFAF